MRLIVNPHKIQLVQEEAVNEKEIDISRCQFEFDEEITDEFVKEAYFTLGNDTYKKLIVNNECTFPQEVLVKEGTVELGVVAYLVENEEEIKRYNPSPVYFKTDIGSLKEAQNSEEITPSEMEQYEQALQDGLSEVNSKLDEIDSALTEVDNLDIDANKVGTTTTITITSKDGTTKEVQVLDGAKGDKGDTGEQGPQGVQGIPGERGLQGEKGDKGDKGDTGERGPQGIQGEKGETGNTGATGPKGDKGDKGDTGETGQAGRDGYVQYTAGDNITIENNVISATGGSDLPIYVLNTTNQLRDDYGIQYLETDAKTTMGDIITDAVSKGYKNISIMVCSTEYGKTYMTYSINNLSANTRQIDFYSDYTQSNRSGSQYICYKYLRSTCSWNNNFYTCSQLLWETSYYLLLTSSNTTSYNVNNNYTPAHKKYVDDSIAAAITTTLGGSF